MWEITNHEACGDVAGARVRDDEEARGDEVGACALEPRSGGIIIATARARQAKSPQGEFARVRGPGVTAPPE